MYCWKNEIYVLLYVGTCKIKILRSNITIITKTETAVTGMSVNNIQMAITQI